LTLSISMTTTNNQKYEAIHVSQRQAINCVQVVSSNKLADI